jgi:serine/threonine protein kinase
MTSRRPPPGSTLTELQASDALVSTELPTSSCLTTDELLQLLQGQLSPSRRDGALRHIEACEDCHVLLAAAGVAVQSDSLHTARGQRGAFAVGDQLSNRYCVERFIARGGMGEVYAVHDRLLNESVALKTLRGTSTADDKAIRRLKSEVLLSRRIGHPHTCRIYEFGEHRVGDEETIHYFTMALVEGETLGQKIRRDGALSAAAVALAARQILAGLAEAHGLGILHRDLKSDNIMLRSPPMPGLAIDAVIMDFGLALRLDDQDRLTTDRHAIVGSLAYMAPEQMESEKLTPATDIYAFGVILFEMLTGRLPFRASTPAAAALQRLRQLPPAPSTVDPKIDPIWDRIVLGCLARSASERFSSAHGVLTALDAPRSNRSASSRKRAAAVAATLLLLCCGVALWSRSRVAPLGSARGNAQPEASTTTHAALPALLPVTPPPSPPVASAPSEPERETEAKDPAPAPDLSPPMAVSPPKPIRRPSRRGAGRHVLSDSPQSRSPRVPVDLPATPPPSPVPDGAPAHRTHIGPLPVEPEFPE